MTNEALIGKHKSRPILLKNILDGMWQSVARHLVASQTAQFLLIKANSANDKDSARRVGSIFMAIN